MRKIIYIANILMLDIPVRLVGSHTSVVITYLNYKHYLFNC